VSDLVSSVLCCHCRWGGQVFSVGHGGEREGMLGVRWFLVLPRY
jgi:hypothetical protein